MTIASYFTNGRTRTLRQRGIALVPIMTQKTAGGDESAQGPLTRQSLRCVTSLTQRLSQNRSKCGMIELR